MNETNRTSLSKKFVVLMTVTGISALISLPVMAQLNPRPRSFDEPPYSRPRSPLAHKPKHHRPKHRLDPLLGERPAPPPAGYAPRPAPARSYDFRPATPPAAKESGGVAVPVPPSELPPR